VESTQSTSLSLEAGAFDGDDTEVRQQVTRICVTELGLSEEDARRLLSSSGPYIVSATREAVDLDSIIKSLGALGVLVRPSSELLDARVTASSRATLYSKQYGDLIGAQRATSFQASLPSKHTIESRRHVYYLPFVVVLILSALTLPSLMGRTRAAPPVRWVERDADYSSSSIAQTTTLDASAVIFRGSATRLGKSMSFQVSRSGANYSARFSGELVADDGSLLRVEGEPFFLSVSEGELAASTPVVMMNQHGALIAGNAQVRIPLTSDGEPRQARVVITLGSDRDGNVQSVASAFVTSFDLLP